MTARKDFVSTFDFLNTLCFSNCGRCNFYISCSEFMIQFKHMANFIRTMSYTEGEV